MRRKFEKGSADHHSELLGRAVDMAG